jgi:hypothetical protein
MPPQTQLDMGTLMTPGNLQAVDKVRQNMPPSLATWL